MNRRVSQLKTLFTKGSESLYAEHMTSRVNEYQKQYGFDMPNGVAHNNEADAFRHTFMQAELTVFFNDRTAKYVGDEHEKKSTSPSETNMDLWNNQIGRQIGREIKNEIKKQRLKPWVSEEDRKKVYDMIAQKVMNNMSSGMLITNPEDKRKYIPRYNLKKDGTLTGLAINIPDEEKAEQLKKENELFAPENRLFYENELNPSLIKEDDNNYNYVDKFIEQYWKDDFKMPTENDLKSKVKSGDLIYVHNYTRADGTSVSGYYRTK